MPDYKLIPYGISDFVQLRRENKYYVDKTMYLPKMELAGNFLYLIRPRRFGKSLFLSMMRYYYDIGEKDSFNELFGDLWIGRNATELHNSFLVLYLDFSQIGGTAETLEENLGRYFCSVLDAFASRYEQYFWDGFADEVKAKHTFREKFDWTMINARRCSLRTYLVVDEYDNFTNTVLNLRGEAVYHAITHAEGFYRDLFKQFKPNFDRIFMMGVSPVTMDDVTSGYNIATSLTLDPAFNMMLGLSETEVREMIRYYSEAGAIDEDEDALIAQMKPWYDGYCFSRKSLQTDPKMYNTDMVSYYLMNYISSGCPPEDMLDRNTATDYSKLDRLIRLDRLDGDRRSVILEIAENGFTMGTVQASFPAHKLIEPEMFRSLLYYYGMLTIVGTRGMNTVLGIPNNNVRRQYYDYLVVEYDKIHHIDMSRLSQAFDSAALDGEWRPMMEYICRQYTETTAVRSLIEGERNLQGFMTAYFSLNPYFLTNPEVELNHGYCDFFLMPDFNRCSETAHSYIIELKYIKIGTSDDAAQEVWDKAVEQIRSYSSGDKVRLLSHGTKLHLIVVIIKGHELYFMGEVDGKKFHILPLKTHENGDLGE